MGGLQRLREVFHRRHSVAEDAVKEDNKTHKQSSYTTRSLKSSRGNPPSTFGGATIDGKASSSVDQLPKLGAEHGSLGRRDSGAGSGPQTSTSQLLDIEEFKHNSTSTADFPTPNTNEFSPVLEEPEEEEGSALVKDGDNLEIQLTSPTPASPQAASHPQKPELPRRQSILGPGQKQLISTLLGTDPNLDYFSNQGPATISPNMVNRKIWVKRPGASATLVTIHEDDLVDDVRDMILKKYANSLGRSFDAPDVTLRIVPRDKHERTLGPEEPMAQTLDAYFPGGQAVNEALVIDVPLRRTPKPSPRPQNGMYYDDHRPLEVGSDYFPPMPAQPSVPSPHLTNAVPVNGQLPGHLPLATHSMSVLTTGHVPNLPSPGSGRRHHRERPKIGRTYTSSPTVLAGSQPLTTQHNGMQAYPPRHPHSRTHSSASEKSIATGAPPAPPPLPTPPAASHSSQIDLSNQIQRAATPPPARVSSPRPQRPKRTKKSAADHPSLPAGMLNGAVPPINVLIVEDNIINLKLLEAFMKRLKVRWQTAMNGREAVTKWRGGGFHLVLMDIQLPIMSGLEATKEIRRLERLNSIGVFSSSASSSAPSEREDGEPEGDDKLPSTLLFKSPVIIVALTASSLQSDRHEALAAGCNDFLTKPVNFVWLERKVMEWGCMQALIDFDGWRKWKDFSMQATAEEDKKKVAAKKKTRRSLGSNAAASGSRVTILEENEVAS